MGSEKIKSQETAEYGFIYEKLKKKKPSKTTVYGHKHIQWHYKEEQRNEKNKVQVGVCGPEGSELTEGRSGAKTEASSMSAAGRRVYGWFAGVLILTLHIFCHCYSAFQ